VIGDLRVVLHPGEEYMGWAYDELKVHGSGACQFPKPSWPYPLQVSQR